MRTEIKEVLNAINVLSSGHNIHLTGHHEWKRIYIKFDDVQYGRISFFRNELYNIKWYGSSSDFDGPLNETDRIHLAVNMIINIDLILSDDMWQLLKERAEILCKKDLEEKLKARALLPYSKKRKGIKGSNVRKFLTYQDLLK